MTMFHVGQMVVCIKTPKPPSERIVVGSPPVAGMVYTIRGFDAHFPGKGIFLEECVLQPKHYREGCHERSFCVSRFRPVKRTSIEELRKLVAPTPSKEREHA